MILITHKRILLTLIAFLLAITVSGLMAQVYKIVDEDGNVTYTDRAPNDGTQPIELRPISVIEAPTYEKASRQDEEGAEKELSLRDLRKNYRDFAIVSPTQEESVWHPEGPVTVAWSTKYQLREGMKVTLFVDGAQHAITSDRAIPVNGLERGEHTLRADLTDAKNRKVASANPVTFFIKQPNLYSNRRRIGPSG